MHHPGPPRFLHVGESVELAPRSPNASGTYAWRVVDKPDGSTVTVESSEGQSPSSNRTQFGDCEAQSASGSRAQPNDSEGLKDPRAAGKAGDSAVVHFTPDVSGMYRVELTAPDGTHTQTVRAFPDPRCEARFTRGH